MQITELANATDKQAMDFLRAYRGVTQKLPGALETANMVVNLMTDQAESLAVRTALTEAHQYAKQIHAGDKSPETAKAMYGALVAVDFGSLGAS